MACIPGAASTAWRTLDLPLCPRSPSLFLTVPTAAPRSLDHPVHCRILEVQQRFFMLPSPPLYPKLAEILLIELSKATSVFHGMEGPHPRQEPPDCSWAIPCPSCFWDVVVWVQETLD